MAASYPPSAPPELPFISVTTTSSPRASTSTLREDAIDAHQTGNGGPISNSTKPTINTTDATLSDGSDLEKNTEDLKDEGEKEEIESVVPVAVVVVAEYPEGGMRGWLTVLGGFLGLFASFGFSNAYGALQAHYQANQLEHYSPSEISWIGSVALCLMFVVGFPCGFLFDAGYFRHEMAFGALCNFLGMLALSYSKTYYQIFLSYSLSVGLGAGMVFGPMVSAIGTYFLKKRGIAIGCSSTGAALGAVFFPLLLNDLFPKLGYGPTVRVAMYLQLGCFVGANILMVPRKLPARARPPTLPLLWSFLKEPETWLICGGCTLTLNGLFMPVFYFQVFTEAHNMPQWLIDNGLSIMNSSAVPARIIFGLTVDRYGKVNHAPCVAFMIAILIYTFSTATSPGRAVTFALFFGFAQGGWITVQAPAIMALSKNVNEIGTRMAVGFLFLGWATLVGSPVGGALLVKAGGYWGPCVFGGTSALVGATLLVLGRMRLAKRAGTWRV